ncbi:MAG: hypothetical protein IJ058_01735 [Lachnospiraceae bacterium]|nr:hypothetical protein [Lachnospiraceae bacterium]MBR1478427.1 hypothetical protein [Lachnospiraceae bacterium]
MKNVYCLKIEDSYYDEYPHAMELIDARFWGKREALLALLEACLKDLPLKVDTEDHANIAIRSVTRQMSVRSGEVKDEMPLRVSRKRRTASKVKQSSSKTRTTSSGHKPELTQVAAPEPAPGRMPYPKPEAKEEKIVFDTNFSAPYIAPGEPGYDPKKDPWRIENLMVLDDEE